MKAFPFKKLSLTVVILATTFAAGLAQERDEKRILEELSKRKVLDVDALKKRVERLSTLSAAELDAELKLLRKEQDAVMEDWRKIDTLRRTKRPGVPPMELRAATFTLKKWQAEREHEARLEALQQREEEAFLKRYKEALSKSSGKYKEWINSDEFRVLQKDKSEINKRLTIKLRELGEEADHGNVDSEKALAKMQRQILEEFSQVADALERASNAVELKKKKKTPGSGPSTSMEPVVPARVEPAIRTASALDSKRGRKPAQLVTALFQRARSADRLVVTTSREGIELLPVGVGDFVRVNVNIHGGTPPYDVLAISSGGSMVNQRYSTAGRHWLLFSFRTPGEHQIRIIVADDVREVEATGIADYTQMVTQHVSVRVIEPKKDEEAKKPDPPAPPPAKQNPATPPPPPALLTPFSGSYRADLWGEIPWPTNGMTKKGIPPTPVSVTFETNGNVSGRCNYTAPDSLFGAHWRKMNSYGWKTQFTLDGKVDWQNGKIELAIPDGRVEYFWEDRPGGSYLRTDSSIEYSATFRARHTSDPFWNKVFQKYPSGWSQLASGPGPAGQPQFLDNGWYFNGPMERHFGGGDTIAEVRYKKFIEKGEAGGKTTINEPRQPLGNQMWYLKLLGPDTTPQDLAKADLVGTSIWPDRKTTAKVGEQVYVTFVGVFGSNYSQIRDLTNIADWQVPPGLQQVQPGVFRAAKPGNYEVRARAKGKDGKWMEGYVTINAVGS